MSVSSDIDVVWSLAFLFSVFFCNVFFYSFAILVYGLGCFHE